MRFFIRLSLVLVALLTLPTVLHAEWINTTSEVPVERLVKNLEAVLAERPEDARAHYVLGRVHSMAYAHCGKPLNVELPTEGEGDLPGFPPWETVRQVGKDKALIEQRETHYRLCIRHYVKATVLSPDEALYHLGLGWMLEDGSAFASVLGTPESANGPTIELDEDEEARLTLQVAGLGSPSFAEREAAAEALAVAMPRSLPLLLAHKEHAEAEIRSRVNRLLKRQFLDRALAAYRRVVALSAKSDAALESFGIAGDQALSLEAGKGIVRIIETRPRTPELEKEIERLSKHIAAMKQIPQWITPIVFPLDGPATLEASLATSRTVEFDLDGDGTAGRWPWVGARTGILVWDPERTGLVRSGRQMFGSVTWWMFWRDGYEPLAALDDDRDGWLAGDELEGIAVWCDANGDAASDPGEVRPVAAWAIERIAVTPDETVGEAVPSCVRGVRLTDGRHLPTYDWTPHRR